MVPLRIEIDDKTWNAFGRFWLPKSKMAMSTMPKSSPQTNW